MTEVHTTSSGAPSSAVPRRAAAWHSFYARVADTADAERVLLDVIPDVLSWLHADRHVRRFYYIQYWENGHQVRLRFQLPANADPNALRNRLTEDAASVTEEDVTVTRESYDRDDLYFGETMASVYAELLNEQSSYLALEVMAGTRVTAPSADPAAEGVGPAARQKRFVVLVAAWMSVLRDVCPDASAREKQIDVSQQFAERVLESHDADVPDAPSERFVESVRGAADAVDGALRERASRQQWVDLLRRAVREGHVHVATHAMHLLVNKTGFSLSEEHVATQVLRALHLHD